MQLKIALDWIPNTIHAGFYIAKHKQWYNNSGIEVIFDSPETDNYAQTPVEKLLQGQVAFAIAPSEYVIQNHLRGNGELVAVATLFQESVTAWATLKKGRVIPNPVYAALKIPYEEVVIDHFRRFQPRFKHLKTIAPPKLQTWELLKAGTADWCWIYLPWEGLEAAHLNLPINSIKLTDAGIPYGHSPLLLTTHKLLKLHHAVFDSFLRFTAAGYFHAADYPKESALILEHYIAGNPQFIYKSLIDVSQAALQVDGSWGIMSKQRWTEYADWLLKQKAIPELPPLDRLYSNSLLVENSFLG
jgi:ABC-type nitrate/sulfonate/bicarbonate transport system substrate-binding protein